MIISFANKETERIWKGERIKGISFELQRTGRRKLRMLNNSRNINDLKILPSNRLKKLEGRLKNFYSIRVNNR
jgi:proteic killer suppression protein